MKRLLYIAVLCVLFVSCTEKKQDTKVLQGNAFGTTYTIQYFSEENPPLQSGLDSVFNAVNQSLSTYIPKSDISRINQGDTTVVNDAMFKEVFLISEIVYNESQGYFDPTVGILRNAYGFGDVAPITEIDSTVLDSLRQYVGFNKVKLRDNGTIWKKYPEIYFDFNAIAKGYGIDRIGEYLEGKGITNYLIELGGELLAKGTNLAKKQPWIVGIETVDSNLENRAYQTTLTLKNSGMASSGNYRKFRINPRTGKKYVHTINPLTGFAEEGDMTSATVIAPTCALADAYATAFMAMGVAFSKKILEKNDAIEGYLTFTNVNNEQEVYQSKGFEALIPVANEN